MGSRINYAGLLICSGKWKWFIPRRFPHPSVMFFAVILAFGSLSTACFGADLSGIRPERVTKSIHLKAIPRSDNGKTVGMEVTIGPSFLKYRAFKGRLELSRVGKFDAHKLPAKLAPSFTKAMDKADIYRVENATEFTSANPGNFLVTNGNVPTYITVLDGEYVDGKRALMICVLSSASMDGFYQTGLGHERCDAFR
ncbi:hypothetical protein HB779_21955 (plasmid) [Phyllobacterium sp. 628]|uniref:hypothetical protein n=1 Tax=Phyllobacterium sp. 628 TaxID=2718938 RepID=UPI0016626AF3|nr:hypothetical protein [Phyllobacterium sp. 628]QND54570.1 hypothetical protein HB779_21955 [Phyllobacterium sp. 628]